MNQPSSTELKQNIDSAASEQKLWAAILEKMHQSHVTLTRVRTSPPSDQVLINQRKSNVYFQVDSNKVLLTFF